MWAQKRADRAETQAVYWAQEQIKHRITHCEVSMLDLTRMCIHFNMPVKKKKCELMQAVADGLMLWTDDEEEEEDEQ